MHKISLACLLLFASRSGFAASLETTQVKTPRGATVTVAISVPDSPVSGKLPAVILAPGQGYHMELPIMKELADRLAAARIVAFRFDWNYYTAKGQPSSDLSKEVEDMQAVFDLARADSRVDVSQIVILGKSMGSVVAFRAFNRNPSAKALVLLTPLCSSPTDEKGAAVASPRPIGPLNYPGLTESKKPTVLALGNADPACFVPHVYDWLKGTEGNISTVVVGGDHGLNVVADLEDPRNAVNIAASVQIIAHWIRLITER